MRESAVREMVAALGRYVKETRRLLGWSQDNLAEAACTSQGLVSRMEAGRCVGLPFMSVLKVLTALAAHESPIGDAVPAPFRFVLACAAHLPGPHPAPPDPHLAQLLQAYHALPSARQAAVVQMLRSLLTMVDDPPPQEMTTL